MEVEQGKMADGRAMAFYHDASSVCTLRTAATVVSGSTILASEICAALAMRGATVLRVDRFGQHDGHASAVYHGTVAMPEIWESIANQYTVEKVIHTALLDPLQPADSREVFAQIVEEGVALLRYLQEYPQRIRLIAASHITAVTGKHADPISRLYGENMAQWERQCMLFAAHGPLSVMLLRVGQLLAGSSPSLTDLWGAPLIAGGEGPALDCLLVEDAARAFVQARAVQQAPAPYWATDVVSEQRCCLQGSALPQEYPDAEGQISADHAQEVLQWRPDLARLERILGMWNAPEGVSS